MGLFDRFRVKKEVYEEKPVEKPAPSAPEEAIPKPTLGEIGYASSYIYGKGTWQKYNPDELLNNKGTKIYSKMMLDDQVKACLRFKQAAVISRGYYFDVEQDDEGEEDQDQREIADFFDAAIKHMRGSFTDKLMEILSALQNGFSVVEKVYEPFTWEDRTMWGFRDMKLRPFDTFQYGFQADEHGNITEVAQNIGGTKAVLPANKIIHFVHQPDKDRIFGESDLRAAYRSWWSKDIDIKFWNIFLERHAAGFIWAQVEGQLSGPQESDLRNLMDNISARTSAYVPKSVTLNQMAPVNTDAYEKAISAHDKAISKSILVPNLLGLSEQGSVGSYSQSEIQLKVFFWILDEIAKRLAETLNENLFRELAIWNFGTEDFPLFTFEAMSQEIKEQIARMWSDLVSKGSVERTDSDEAYIRRLIGFPEKAEVEEVPPGSEGIFPSQGDIEDDGGDDTPPDNEDWINEQPEDKQEHIRKCFTERPWLKRMDFSRIKRDLDYADEGLVKDMCDIMGKVRLSLEDQITRIVGDRSLGKVNLKEFDALYIPGPLLTTLRKSLRNRLQDIFGKAYKDARKELPKKVRMAKKPYRPGMDRTQAERFLASRTMRVAGVTKDKTLESVQRVLENGIRYDKSLSATMKDLDSDTDLVQMLPKIDAAGRPTNVPARLENIVRTNTAYAYNEARQALFTEPEFKGFVEAFEYSAILDDRTSEVCESLDGRIQKDWGGYSPPNHFQCRSLLVPVTTVDDWSGKEDNIPSSVKPQKGFM